MITALDSSILIDVLIEDPKHGAASEAALGQARREGALIICETVLAGGLFRQYLNRGGKRNRVFADFLIGAHAKCFATRLLTRGRGYYRDYFKDLEIWNP